MNEACLKVADRCLSQAEDLVNRPEWGDFVLAEGLIAATDVSSRRDYLDLARRLLDLRLEALGGPRQGGGGASLRRRRDLHAPAGPPSLRGQRLLRCSGLAESGGGDGGRAVPEWGCPS